MIGQIRFLVNNAGIGINAPFSETSEAQFLAPGAIETDFGGGVVRDNTEVNDFIAGQRLEVSGGMVL